jgi:uncharacterized protein YdeI (YjbR/CyaY-like superfamily)
MDPKPVFFRNADEFRRWLEKNHSKAQERWLGYYKKGASKTGITYKQAVEEALCFGWIDGLTKSLDAESYMQRFTPRRSGSNWSNINVGHIKRLTAEGKMHPAGIAAFKARDAAKTGIYSFERQQPAKLPPAFEKKFRANRAAWKFFTAQAPWYQRLITHKIVSPKLAATRERWLTRAIEDSAAGKRISGLPGTTKKSDT